NKVLYYSLLIFSMIVSHYWTYEIIPRVCNISKNRLYVCDIIIILLGCFFIIHTLFLDFSLGKSYTEFVTLYGSFIIYYKIINLIILILPKNLTKKYLIIFPWTRRQKLYEGMEDVQKIYMYDWFLGLEVLEEMMPFYEEMAD